MPVPAHMTIQKSWRSSIIRAPSNRDACRRAPIERVETDLVLGPDRSVPAALPVPCPTAGLRETMSVTTRDHHLRYLTPEALTLSSHSCYTTTIDTAARQ